MSLELSPRAISLVRMYSSDISDKIVRLTVESMEKRGIIDAGYNYVIIGDRWAAPRRDGDGRLVADAERFPNGIGSLADFLHEKGLKLGIVTSAGVKTAGGAPGCFDCEYSDAEAFAAWGVDYVIHDIESVPHKADVPTLIRRMGMALRASGRKIGYSVYSEEENIHRWIRSASADSYCTRTYKSSVPVMLPDEKLAGYSAPYCFLSCGELFIKNSTPVCDIRRQLATAAIMSSPVIVDCDTCALSEEQLAAVCNKEVTDIACDSDGRPARRLAEGVYCKLLDGNEYAVAFINDTDTPRELTFYTYDFGLTPESGFKCRAVPMFSRGEAVEFNSHLSVNVPAGDAEVYRMTLAKEAVR